MRPSRPALDVVGRAIAANRDRLIQRWTEWVLRRLTHAPKLHRPTLERQIALLVDFMIELAGPLRRHVLEAWYGACDLFGRTAAARGLAAGEVVEEIQYLRELLIRTVSEPIATLPARQAMAAVLRLNRAMDRGISHAVVGYTDSLVEILFERQGVPVSAATADVDELATRLEQMERDLAELRLGAP